MFTLKKSGECCYNVSSRVRLRMGRENNNKNCKICERKSHASRAFESIARTYLLRNCIVEELQDADFDFTFRVVAQVSEVGQEPNEEVKIARLIGVGAGKDIAHVRDRDDCGVCHLLLRRRFLLNAHLVLFSFMLLLQTLLLLLLHFLDCLTACLINELLSRRISSDVVFSNDLHR